MNSVQLFVKILFDKSILIKNYIFALCMYFFDLNYLKKKNLSLVIKMSRFVW